MNEINQSIGFDLSPHWDLSWQRVQEIDFYRVLFVRWPLEKWTNYTLLPALAVGLCQVIRDRHKRWTLVWILGVYVAFFLTAISSSTHDYYTLIIVPPMALIVGVGLETLLRQGRKWAPIALVLVLASPVVAQRAAKLRIEPIPEFAAVREDAAKVIPRDALVMVEDNTPPIRLYELDRRGWPMRMGIDSDRVAYCVNRGAEFLVTVRPIDEFESRMRPLFDTTVWRIGPWYAFRVKD